MTKKSVSYVRNMIVTPFETACYKVAKEFASYMGYDCDDMYTIGDDVSGTWQCADDYYDISTMYEVLKYEYTPFSVRAYYDYNRMYSGENNKHGISMYNFMELYDGSPLEEWAKNYHQEVDSMRAYWNSPEGKKEERETFKKAAKKHGFEL